MANPIPVPTRGSQEFAAFDLQNTELNKDKPVAKGAGFSDVMLARLDAMQLDPSQLDALKAQVSENPLLFAGKGQFLQQVKSVKALKGESETLKSVDGLLEVTQNLAAQLLQLQDGGKIKLSDALTAKLKTLQDAEVFPGGEAALPTGTLVSELKLALKEDDAITITAQDGNIELPPRLKEALETILGKEKILKTEGVDEALWDEGKVSIEAFDQLFQDVQKKIAAAPKPEKNVSSSEITLNRMLFALRLAEGKQEAAADLLGDLDIELVDGNGVRGEWRLDDLMAELQAGAGDDASGILNLKALKAMPKSSEGPLANVLNTLAANGKGAPSFQMSGDGGLGFGQNGKGMANDPASLLGLDSVADDAMGVSHTRPMSFQQFVQNAIQAARHQSNLPHPASDQVAVKMSKAAVDGDSQISIKLRPAALGHVRVEMNINEDGRIQAVIAADKPETLELLQRDSRHLERALQAAGLQANAQDLQFQLGSGQRDAREVLEALKRRRGLRKAGLQGVFDRPAGQVMDAYEGRIRERLVSIQV